MFIGVYNTVYTGTHSLYICSRLDECNLLEMYRTGYFSSIDTRFKLHTVVMLLLLLHLVLCCTVVILAFTYFNTSVLCKGSKYLPPIFNNRYPCSVTLTKTLSPLSNQIS